MAMKHYKSMFGRACLASVACLMVFISADCSAGTWTGNAGNCQINEASNYSGGVWNGVLCTIDSQPSGPLILKPGNTSFFGGARLHYSGAFAVTNDFGVGKALEDIGAHAKNSNGNCMQVLDGAQLVQISGGIAAQAAGNYKGSYINDNSSFTLDGADSWFNQTVGSVYIRSSVYMDETVYPKLFVQNGASLTANTALIVGSGGNNVSAYACVTGPGSTLSASVFTIGDNGDSPVIARTNLLRIADSAAATAPTVNIGSKSSHAVLEVDGGTLDVSEKISVGASGNVATSNCVLRVADGTLNYGTIYLYCDGNALDFSNATLAGGRIEMTRSSSIRLFNTHLTIPSGIFMMGDGDGSIAANNALKRDIYVGGTDTWVKVSDSRGFWVRGSNTTMRVHVPAEGFSTSHPVFDLNKIVYGSAENRLRIEVTADEPTEQADRACYTLFKCSGDDSCRSDQIEWIVPDSDVALIKIDKSVEKEVRIRVSRKHGLAILVK